jgi:hypothetical protein
MTYVQPFWNLKESQGLSFWLSFPWRAMLRASKSPGKLENNDFYAFEQLANLRTIGALRTISGRRTISEPSFTILFFFDEKKQNEKNPHENEANN